MRPPDYCDGDHATGYDRWLPNLVTALQTAGLGTLVLLGALFCVSFTSRFAALSDIQRGMYVTSVVLAGLATILLLAPAACLRLAPAHQPADQLIRAVNGMAAGGLAATGLAVSAATRLAVRWAASGVTADLIGAGTAVLFAVAWFGLSRLLNRGSAQARTGPPG